MRKADKKMKTLKQIIEKRRLYSDYHNEETLLQCVKEWLQQRYREKYWHSYEVKELIKELEK